MDARTTRWTRSALAGSAIAVAVALLATACSSSGNGTSSAGAVRSGSSTAAGGSAAAAGGSAAAAGAPAAAGGSATAGAAAGTIGMRSGPSGSYLADGSGRSLYLFTSDGVNSSSCSGTCSTYWPALTGSGTPAAATGVTAGLLASFIRPDGSRQISYAGHPLYYYALDNAAGDTKGQGLNDFGARWWLLSPSGMPITGGPSATGSASAGSSAGSNGGYGGGGYGG